MKHPESEDLAAFVDGKLGGAALAAVTEHLLGCEECRAIAGEAARFRLEGSERRSKPGGGRWWMMLAAAAVASVLFIFPRSDDALTGLQSDHRSWQGRIVGFDYAPFRVSRSAPSTDYRRYATAAKLEERLKQDRTAANLHKFGVAELALGKPREAVALFEEALALAPRDAAILSDLSAAELASGDAWAAGEHAAQALEIDGRHQPAAYNAALALQTLSNRQAAIAAWQNYLALDGESEWAAEARRHLSELTRPRSDWDRDKKLLTPGAGESTVRRIAQTYPQRVRDWVQEDLLPRWCRERQQGYLQLAQQIARVRAERGDDFVADAVAHSAAGTATTFEAIRLWESAAETFRARDFLRAGEQLGRASARLAQVGSPLRLPCEVKRATNDYYGGRYDDALRRLGAVEREIGERRARYPALAAQLEWVRGNVYTVTGRPNEALAAYRRGQDIAGKAGEIEDEIAMGSLLSGLLDTIGDVEEASEIRRNVLRRVDSIGGGSQQRKYVTYIQATFAALRERRPRMALAFNQVIFHIAESEQEPLYLAESRLTEALAWRDLGNRRAAKTALAAARDHAAGIALPGLRQRILVDIDLAEGTADSASRALTVARQFGWRRREIAALLIRGEASFQDGHAERAEEDWRAGIAAMEEQRRDLSEPALQITYFERADAPFGRLIQFLLDAGRSDEAFDVAERKRARTLLDRISARGIGSDAPVTARQVASEIGGAVALVSYAVLPGEVAIWIATRGSMNVVRSAVPRAELEEAVQRFLAAIESSDQAAMAKESRWLATRLLDPILVQAGNVDEIAVVPDGALHTLPFAALQLDDGTFLIERCALTVAPSASVHAKRARPTWRPDALLAAIGRVEALPALPAIGAETARVTALYEQATVLEGRALTVRRFLDAAAEASTIHYAGHAASDEVHHSPAALLFSSDARLDAAALAGVEWKREPLVVLAACRTGVGRAWRNEGPNTLAAAFLAAGAMGVVATLWDIPDEPSARFFTAFHENLARGSDPAAALQSAQLRMLRSAHAQDREPASWAGAVFIGRKRGERDAVR